jgi:hypothetical protein
MDKVIYIYTKVLIRNAYFCRIWVDASVYLNTEAVLGMESLLFGQQPDTLLTEISHSGVEESAFILWRLR